MAAYIEPPTDDDPRTTTYIVIVYTPHSARWSAAFRTFPISSLLPPPHLTSSCNPQSQTPCTPPRPASLFRIHTHFQPTPHTHVLYYDSKLISPSLPTHPPPPGPLNSRLETYVFGRPFSLPGCQYEFCPRLIQAGVIFLLVVCWECCCTSVSSSSRYVCDSCPFAGGGLLE
ncbi:hypothetical protein PENSPDRAFT_286175 [Peniophora sp. CONT]|nr:hypothetical protein PENSPDRAFT_286175 [Peniophora sp. CONT]